MTSWRNDVIIAFLRPKNFFAHREANLLVYSWLGVKTPNMSWYRSREKKLPISHQGAKLMLIFTSRPRFRWRERRDDLELRSNESFAARDGSLRLSDINQSFVPLFAGLEWFFVWCGWSTVTSRWNTRDILDKWTAKNKSPTHFMQVKTYIESEKPHHKVVSIVCNGINKDASYPTSSD